MACVRIQSITRLLWEKTNVFHSHPRRASIATISLVWAISPSCRFSLGIIYGSLTLQASTNRNIEKNIECSETKFDQWFDTKHGKIIAHVFTMILCRTCKHNRPDVLWNNRYIYVCAQNSCRIWKILPVHHQNRQYILLIRYKNMIQKQYTGFCREH
jgi:hypothetical protein